MLYMEFISLVCNNVNMDKLSNICKYWKLLFDELSPFCNSLIKLNWSDNASLQNGAKELQLMVQDFLCAFGLYISTISQSNIPHSLILKPT
jgi:hypothetical protein